MNAYLPSQETLTALTDEELVERCKRELPGNTQSYELLVQRHTHLVYRLVFRMVCNREEAEDITQEVFVKAYKNLHTFKQQASFSTWLYRIATNSAFDGLVKLKRQRNTIVLITTCCGSDAEESSVIPRLQLSPIVGPEERVIQAELGECMRQVLKTLTPEQARLLVMRDYDDLSYDEIANVLGVSVSAVKMRIHRARLAFQEVFNRHYGSAYPAYSASSPARSGTRTK